MAPIAWSPGPATPARDGVEIVFDTTDSETVWSAFDDVQPCGLGARDTLRLEAGLLLSGQDFHPEDEPRNPIEADLDFVVSDDKESFVGKEAVDRGAKTASTSASSASS